MKTLELTKGLIAKIDDDDFDRLSKYKWHASLKSISLAGRPNYYVMRSIRLNKKRKGIYLHREVMNAINGQDVDHIDGDSMNNQKSNLRLCSDSQNLANRPVYHRKKARFRGIYRVEGRWAAKCVRKYIGCFGTDVEAAKAYDRAAFEKFGEFATLNFP